MEVGAEEGATATKAAVGEMGKNQTMGLVATVAVVAVSGAGAGAAGAAGVAGIAWMQHC